MARKTLTEKLESARLLIFNSKDVEVAPLLETMGIDTAHIQRGEVLYRETAQLVDIQKKEYQDQNLAYDTFFVEKDEIEADFNRTLKLVRVLSRKDKDLQDRLGLRGDRVYGIEEWIESAIDFYNRLLNEPDFITKLERFNVTTKQLDREKPLVESLKQLRKVVTAEKGQAQEPTRLRNEKLDELDDYTVELRVIAEIALEGRPQLLEKLGIMLRS